LALLEAAYVPVDQTVDRSTIVFSVRGRDELASA
jgi:hypothetical protein